MSDPDLFGGAIAIRGIAGDQQAATVGQACFEPGMVKSTYGTGCFAVLNTGNAPVTSQNRLLTTIAYQFDGKPTYALEGAIFVAGAAVQWLRDGLHILEEAAQSGDLAAIADADQEVYMVPAFVGLGAPYWDAECRGAIFGLTRGTGRAELARAALEAVCFQTNDLIDAMHADWRAAGHDGAGAGCAGAARRWRHGGLRLDDAAAGRRARRPRRQAPHARDDGAGGRLSCRLRRRGLSETGGVCRRVGRWSAGSRRRWTRPCVRERSMGGAMRCRARSPRDDAFGLFLIFR